jgi:hypothetical protein
MTIEPDLADPNVCCGGMVTRWRLLPFGGVATRVKRPLVRPPSRA